MKSCLTAFALTVIATSAAPTSGHAKAEWIADTPVPTTGTIRTVVKLSVDESWHTYWINPGEGGMPLSVSWDLPEGWSAGDIQHPAPIRFMTGDLPGLGYEAEVLLPVDITPPPSISGPVTLSGKLSWLACNDSSCVPGSAEISLRIESGPSGDDKGAGQHGLIEKAYSAIPQPLPDSVLKVELEKENIVMTLTLPPGSDVDPTEFEIFPATRNVIDPAAKPTFKEDPDSPNTWRARALTSEYLNGMPESISLVLANGDKGPFVISTPTRPR